MRFKNDYLDLSGYSDAFFGVLHIVSPQWSLFWYTEFIEAANSSQDLSDHRPNLGFSVLKNISISFLIIIYNGRGIFKYIFLFKKVIKWTPFTAFMTYRTCKCVRILRTRFFSLTICPSSNNSKTYRSLTYSYHDISIDIFVFKCFKFKNCVFQFLNVNFLMIFTKILRMSI